MQEMVSSLPSSGNIQPSLTRRLCCCWGSLSSNWMCMHENKQYMQIVYISELHVSTMVKLVQYKHFWLKLSKTNDISLASFQSNILTACILNMYKCGVHENKIKASLTLEESNKTGCKVGFWSIIFHAKHCSVKDCSESILHMYGVKWWWGVHIQQCLWKYPERGQSG